MQMIENRFSPEILNIKYESSIQNIIENGITFSNLKNVDESLDEEEQQKFVQEIEAYQNRINEANQLTLNTISLLLQDPYNNDENSSIALLPSMYSTNAVFTIDLQYKDEYLNMFTDNFINPLFKELVESASSLAYDMTKIN